MRLIAEYARCVPRRVLWKIHECIVDYLERRYHFSPLDEARNRGYVEGLRFAAEQLAHYAWGHPEITMKGAAEAMEHYAREWEAP